MRVPLPIPGAAAPRRFLALALCLAVLLLSGCLSSEEALKRSASGVFRLLNCQELASLQFIRSQNASIATELETRGIVVVQDVKLFLHAGQVYAVRGHGSGYLVSDDGYLVTNDHVVNAPDSQMFVVMGITPSFRVLPASVIWKDGKKDLAVVLVNGLPNNVAPLVLADPAKIREHSAVKSIGFPGASDELTSGGGLGDERSFLSPKVHSGGYLTTKYLNSNNVQVWEHTTPTSGGNSGGPLVNEGGLVVGTNHAHHKDKQSAVNAIANEELLPELDRLHIGYTTGSGGFMTDTEKVMYALLAGFGVLALVLAGFGIYVFRLRSQVKKGQIPRVKSKLVRKMAGIPDNGGRPNAPAYPGQGQAGMPPRPGMGQPGMAQPGMPPRPPAGQPGMGQPGMPYSSPFGQQGMAAQAVLKSRLGQPDIILRAGQPVVVGASPAAAQHVIGNPVVSAAHLRLTYDGSRVLVEDLGSTNGTFIDGNRLTAPAVLGPGSLLQLTPRQGVAEFTLAGTGGVPTPSPTPIQSGLTLYPLFPGVKPVSLPYGGQVSIGRDPGNSLVLDEAIVSKRHCMISLANDGSLFLQDLGSTNGTFLQGATSKVTGTPLAMEQIFYVAEQTFPFKVGR